MRKPPKHRSTRRAFRAEDTPRELIDALMAADYSHLGQHPNEPLK